MQKKYDFLIVGSGIFGATIAYILKTKFNKKCLVVEKRHHIGGNVYCSSIEDINVHVYGAHIFHTSNDVVWKFVTDLVPFNNFVNSPIAVYKDEVFNLPFNMNTFLQVFGERDPAKVMKMIDADKSLLQSKPSNLEEQAISLVGKTIYEKLIKGYTEKQWGRSCSQLPAFIIKRLPLRFTFNNNYFNDPHQGIPIGGYNKIIQKLLDGVDVRVGEDYFAHREELDNIASRVVYTGPIDQYFDYSLGELEYRSVRFETEILDVPNYQGVAVVNYTDTTPDYTRVIEHKHFECLGNDVYDNKKTVVSREYSQTWTRGMEPYYPVNDQKNQDLYQKYRELGDKLPNVSFGGRLASYKYYDMDKTIEYAMQLADKLGSLEK